MDDIFIAALMDILTGEAMITGIILTGHTSTGVVMIAVNTMHGNMVTKNIIEKTTAGNKTKPFANFISAKGFIFSWVIFYLV